MRAFLHLHNGWFLGLHIYAKSLGFSEECLGKHVGNIHDADLGDGDGKKGEQFLARQHYFPVFGTCWESLVGQCFLCLKHSRRPEVD